MCVKQEMILRYFREGHSQRKISRDLGLSRKTVNRYVAPYAATLKDQEENEPKDFVEELTKSPSYNISNRKSSKLTPSLKAEIKRLLEINRERRLSGRCKQQYKKIDIWEHLKKAGYSIGYSTICKVISEYENETREAFIRQRYSPGDICEFDWGEVKIDTGNGLERYQIAVFTSGYSNYRYACLFKSQDTSSFQQAHVYFFEKIDGVYREMVYDNMKVAVKRFVGPTEKEATVGLLKMATYYNFSYRFCNVRKGNEKGHVERSVEVVRRKAFAIKDKFSNLKEANLYLENICDELKLPGIRKHFKEITDEAASKNLSFEEYLNLLFEKEYEVRVVNREKRRMRTANFPFKKYLENLVVEDLPKDARVKLETLKTLKFIEDGHNLILAGNPGTGKTHIAIGLGIKACLEGMTVLFTTVPALITKLKESQSERTMRLSENRFEKYDLIICDEMGYISFDKKGAELLFTHLSLRAGRKSTIITTNLSFDRWGEIFGDPVLTAAMVDRLTHKAYMVNMNGSSYRIKETKKWNDFQNSKSKGD